MNLIPSNLPLKNGTPARAPRRAFTLVELLIVISIIGLLAGFIIAAMGPIKKNKAVSAARAELAQLQTAIENYHAKYGVYPPSNQRAAANYPPPTDRALFSQLYYELTGTTSDGVNFVTLGGSSAMAATTIPVASVPLAYGVGGFINCTKGGAEDSSPAKNFLLNLSTRQYFYPITNNGSGTPIPTAVLVTAVGGPDDSYLPFGPGSSGLNPIRYLCPGVNNPTSYDLWVQLVVGGKTNLVCNWTKNVQVNTSYP